MQNSRTMSLDLEKQPSSLTGSNSSNADLNKPRKTTKQVLPVQIDIKIIVVWLESLEDFTHFPIGIIMQYLYKIYISFN